MITQLFKPYTGNMKDIPLNSTLYSSTSKNMKLGTKFRVIHNDGIVIKAEAFFYDKNRLHDCDGKCNTGLGYYINSEAIKFFSTVKFNRFVCSDYIVNGINLNDKACFIHGLVISTYSDVYKNLFNLYGYDKKSDEYMANFLMMNEANSNESIYRIFTDNPSKIKQNLNICLAICEFEEDIMGSSLDGAGKKNKCTHVPIQIIKDI